MKRDRVAAALAYANVRAASLLVPRGSRVAWVAEWNAEIYHLSHGATELAGAEGPHALAFSRGAFPDALWLRRDHLRMHGVAGLQPGSAGRCALVLATLALMSLVVCLVLPEARRALLPLHTLQPAELVAITPAGYAGTESPDIALEEYVEWRTDTRKLFSELAWYHPAVKNVAIAHGPTTQLAVGIASANLLQVLHVSVSGEPPRASEPTLVLTRSAWRSWHHGDSRMLSDLAFVDGTPVRVAVLREDDGRLPEGMEAWLLEDEAGLERLSPHARGFVFARIRSAAFPRPRGGVRLMLERRHGVTQVFDCISVSWLAWQPTSNFLFALLLACLALPATTALPLGDYPRYRGRMAFSVASRRWAFLVFKLLLLIAIVYLATIALACGPAWAGSTAVFLQIATAFPALLFGFRWCLQDQRQRCPECLRRLSSPARVGQASCNFLSWNGTELFCVRGHGLLHIPELPTSWCSTQRWLCLDSSWRGLFVESRAVSAEMV